MPKILIADDEPKIRRGLIKRIISLHMPFDEFIECEDGNKALSLFIEHMPPIIIADINMPFMNGLEFIEKVKTIQKDTAIIIISGYDRFDYAKKAISLNVMEYLLKPVSNNELEAALNKALDATAHLYNSNNNLSDTVSRIKQYIDKNYSNEKLSLVLVANIFSLSESYITTLMKKELNLTFNEYLTNVRIENAKHLLKDEGRAIKIYQVAELVGYNSQHYFSRVFKKVTGMTPLDFIEK